MINKEKSVIKQLLPHAGAVLFFLVLTMAYFMPLIEGKVIPQHDVIQYKGSSQELREYYEKDGESSPWTGSMFGGMPAYQIGVWGGSPNFLDYLEVTKTIGGGMAGAVFTSMLMAYILFIMMGFRPIYAVMGAIAYSLSSYNFVILYAGHITKAWALAYMPLVASGLVAVYRNKLLLGGVLFALGLALQIKNNHLQITYYTGMLCAIVYLGFIIRWVMKKEFSSLLKATGILAIACVIAVLCNAGNFYSNYLMSQESTRGKSELTNADDARKQSDGLDKRYVFDWSYGKTETLTLLIPNLYGGSSIPYDTGSEGYKAMVKEVQAGSISSQNANYIVSNIRQYWGPQPITQGTVYFGAVICMLFLLGMIVIRSRMKWVLFAATVFFIFLAWGKNLEWFNDLFFYYFPYYNKLRAVSMTLVIPALTMVIIAIWGVKEFFEAGYDKKKLSRSLYIAAGVTGGICLIMWLMPGMFFNFVTEADQGWRYQVPASYFDAVLQDRRNLLSADAMRSFIFIVLAAALLWVSIISKAGKKRLALYLSAELVVLVLVDLWTVDRRYLNDSNYVDQATLQNQSFPQTVADKVILQDTDPSYRVLRVLDDKASTFADAATSYYHKSIGGYHAAKLKRYQELIEHRLQGEVSLIENASLEAFQQTLAYFPVNEQGQPMINTDTLILAVQDSVAPVFLSTPMLNAFNTRYVIYHTELPPVQNPYALGNAWFVNEYRFVNNADEEIASLDTLDPARTAVIDKRFEQEVQGLSITSDSMASIVLTEYKPNSLVYKYKSASEQLVVFSENYFADGWQAYIDGKEAPHFRADWTLRAMRVPAGEHEIVFVFEPKAYNNARLLATASSGLLILLLIGTLVVMVRKKKTEEEEA